ncbi:uroporphyrinogen-III C-methyltransferase [Salibacterium sp. K-3]
MEESYGTIHIVGAGPGSPDLITLRGAECLRIADVVLYDRLAHPALLLHAPADAKLIYCGKKPCDHTLRQEDIQHEMIVQARRGKKVVRLKGGDPGIFGRLAEELEELKQRRIPYEIVPGITAGSAAASYAGVSLTHRREAHGYRVMTGHGHETSGQEDMDWENLAATTDTLIWYMSVKRLPMIADQLLGHGKDPATPVLMVEWAAHNRQRTVSGSLDTIETLADEQNITNPSIILIGKAAGQHGDHQWFRPSETGGILAFPQNRLEQHVFEQLKTEGQDVYIHPLLSEDSHYSENTEEIMNRLLEEGFIRHAVFPSSEAGQQLYETLLQRKKEPEHLLTFWMTVDQAEPGILTSLLPVLPLETPEEWQGRFLAEEHQPSTDTISKAMV